MAFETVGALLASKWGPLVVQGACRESPPSMVRLRLTVAGNSRTKS